MDLAQKEAANGVQCPLCGARFNADEHKRCSQCPFGNRCSLICCPQCGYQMVDERKSTLAALVKRLQRPKPTRPIGGGT